MANYQDTATFLCKFIQGEIYPTTGDFLTRWFAFSVLERLNCLLQIYSGRISLSQVNTCCQQVDNI